MSETKSKPAIWLVQTRLVAAVWDEVAPILKPAIEIAAGRHTLQSTQDQLRSGYMQLFLAVRDDKPCAVAVSQVVEYPSADWLVVLFCAGMELPEWGADGIAAIEDWARRCGCSGVEIVGSSDWAAALGYDRAASVLSRAFSATAPEGKS